MLKSILFCLLLLLVISCRRANTDSNQVACTPNTLIPGGYLTPLTSAISYNTNHCGLLPLGKNNYWVYLDSVFDATGQFQRSLKDTVRFSVTYQTPDGIVWWSRPYRADTTVIGFDTYMYSTDSTVYTIAKGWGGGRGTKWFYTINTLTGLSEQINYADMDSPCFAQKIASPFTVPAGTFFDCMYFTKQRTWATGIELRTWYKNGAGMLRTEGYLNNIVFRSSTLLSYYIEQ